MNGTLTLHEYGDTWIRLEFEHPRIGYNYVIVSYYPTNGVSAKTLNLDIDVTKDIYELFYIWNLDSDTEYVVNIFDPDDVLLASGVFATSGSIYKPMISKYIVKRNGSSINYDITLWNLNRDYIDGSWEEGCDVSVRLDGSRISKWDGDDVDKDGMLTITGSIPCSESNNHTFRLEAYNYRINMSSGEEEYEKDETLIWRESFFAEKFAWDIPKISGQSLRVSASEWNRFTSAIREVLESRGETTSFTTAVSAGLPQGSVVGGNHGLSKGKVISASIINEAVRALKSMGASVSEVASNQPITADFFNDIVTKLNSIT